jgi:lysozyme
MTDFERLRLDLESDEGCINEVYLDHLGYPTFGIGHLIKDTDPEYGCKVGEKISAERVAEAFEDDIQITYNDCLRLYSDFDMLPTEVQLIIANMMYNLGATRLGKFKGMKAAVDSRDWQKAADEMIDSLWYKQVTNRANRLVDRMRALDEKV